jgi:hypothetical protein
MSTAFCFAEPSLPGIYSVTSAAARALAWPVRGFNLKKLRGTRRVSPAAADSACAGQGGCYDFVMFIRQSGGFSFFNRQ